MMKKKENQSSQRRRRVDYHDQDVEFVNVNITEDLIMEILLRVPAINVLRFKCVSKKWYSLISNPDFLRSHSSLQFEKRTDLLIHAYDIRRCLFSTHFEFLFLPQDNLQLPLLKVFHPNPLSLFPENRRHCQLEDSCNGLLLLCFSEASDLNVGDLTYYIFNLITKHYFKLPSMNLNLNPMPNIKEKDMGATSSHIMFDPSVSHSYKVIQCWVKDFSESPDDIHCQLYSSETGSWRLLSTSFPMNPFEVGFCLESRPTLLNGVLYWSYGFTSLDVSYYFDVEKESVSFLPLPPKPIGCDVRDCLYFGECDGHLRLIEKYFLDDTQLFTLPCSFDIMEMDPDHQHRKCQDDCSPWIVKYHVNIEMVFNRPFLIELPCLVDFIHCYKVKNKGGGEEEVLFLSINQTSIVSYNLTNNTFGKELTVSNDTTISTYEFNTFFPFTPTLFPIS